MAITERQRHQLFIRAEAVLGPAEAETMMELISPASWTDLASKRDVAGLGTKVDQCASKAELAQVAAKVDLCASKAELAQVAAKVDLCATRTELVGLRERVDERFADMTRTFVTWMLASQAAFTAMVAIFFSVAT